MRCCPLLCTHLSLLLFLILYSTNLINGESSCPSNCGDMSIPYPFGIGKGCFFDEWFEIQCINSTDGGLVPYLPKIKTSTESINLPDTEEYSTSFYPYGSLRIKTNIISSGCSNTDGRMVGEVLNLTGSSFTIDASNVLINIGCNSKATLTNLESKFVDACRVVDLVKTGINQYVMVTNVAEHTHLLPKCNLILLEEGIMKK